MNSAANSVRVWDLPTRSFHWLLVAAFVVAMLSAGHARYLDVHVFAGYLILALLLFRLLWGFIGTRHARFAAFVQRPAAVADYWRALHAGRRPALPGHNPAGGWAIVLMLSLLAAITLSGLAVLGGEEQHGPLMGWLSIDSGVRLHAVHEFLAWLMVSVVVLHLFGVAGESRWLGSNLVAAMWHGRKHGIARTHGVPAHRLLGLFLPLLVLIAAAMYFRGWFVQDRDHPYLPFAGPLLMQNQQWQEECGSCHLAFHPSLLPARSWQYMLAQQADHFGDDLALSEESMQVLQDYAVANAAEQGATEAAWRIGHAIAPDKTPLRITEVAYWRRTHAGISDSVWSAANVRSKANCAACHRDAAVGTFNDSAMRVPPLSHSNEEVKS